jgi:hypothetical protein
VLLVSTYEQATFMSLNLRLLFVEPVVRRTSSNHDLLGRVQAVFGTHHGHLDLLMAL